MKRISVSCPVRWVFLGVYICFSRLIVFVYIYVCTRTRAYKLCTFMWTCIKWIMYMYTYKRTANKKTHMCISKMDVWFICASCIYICVWFSLVPICWVLEVLHAKVFLKLTIFLRVVGMFGFFYALPVRRHWLRKYQPIAVSVWNLRMLFTWILVWCIL